MTDILQGIAIIALAGGTFFNTMSIRKNTQTLLILLQTRVDR